MYIAFKGKEKQYAHAKESKREGRKVTSTSIYLGKVADRELGVFYTPERGFFTFDVKTRQYGAPPPAFLYPLDPGKNRAMAFGGAFFLNAFLHRTGMMELIDSLPFGNKDTVRAMVLFYVLSPLANCHAERWYKSSIARLLFPRASLASQRISEMLAAIGSADSVQNYQEKHVAWVFGRLSSDRNILVDSTALENSVRIPLSRPGIHNGVVEVCLRFIAVVQRGGMPLYFKTVSGNTVDVSTLPFTLETMKAMGVDVESCTVDAGYNCASNLDMFYDGDHSCVIDFVSRAKSNDLELKHMIDAERDSLQDRANLVNYDGRWVFIKKKRIFVGRNKDNPAWLYLGLDLERNGEEMKNLSEKAAKKKFTDDEVYELTRRGGLFALVSGREYACGEILPRYYERQAAEQLFDFLKNYAKITPLRAWTEETVRGHQLLSFIACTVVTLLHLILKPKDMGTWESLKALECLLCTRYRGRIVVDPREKEEAEVFRAAGIECPHALPVAGGRLCYAPPAAVDRPLENGAAPEGGEPSGTGQKPEEKKRGRPKGSKNKKTLEREALGQAGGDPQPARRPGRPKGSKNKATLEREAQARAAAEAAAAETEASGSEATAEPGRKRGRPKGSKNKKTLEREAEMQGQLPPPKRGPGRPKGSRNKKKEGVEADRPAG